MKSNWKEVKLGDVIKTNCSTLKKGEYTDYAQYLDTGNITENKIDLIQKINLLNGKLPSRAKRKVKYNSILYSTVRPNQKHYGIIKNIPDNFVVSTGFIVIDADEQKINPNFLFYLISQQYITDKLHAIAEQSVSTYPSIKSSDIEELKFNIPKDINEQQKIASILSSIDDKIELNNSINNNLEQQAQAIFKSWFVDFEPFGGTMPKDWKNGTIEDLSQNIICGKTPSTSKKEYYGNDMPFITIPDMHNNTYVTKTERYLSCLGASSQKNKILPPNSICVSCIATAGLVSITAFYSQTNQQINSIIPAQEISSYYIYLLLQSLSKKIIMLGSSGSTTCNLNKGQFAKIEVIIPDKNVLKKYDEIVTPLFESIKNNQLENEQLIQLRDTLLPKLMSGEIDVSNVDISTDKLYEPAYESKLSAEPYNSSGSFASARKNLPSEQSSTADKLSFSEGD